MIDDDETVCPKCGGSLIFFDSVKRIVRTKYGICNKIILRRFRCLSCGSIHREIPKIIFPYKQYESEIITGVREGLITSNTLGFEDNPCEETMKRWKNRN